MALVSWFLDHWFAGFVCRSQGPPFRSNQTCSLSFQCFVDTGGGEMWFFGKDLVGFAFGVFAFHIPIFQNPLAYLFVLLGMLANQEI